jgi:hypothetical protein
MKPGESLSLDDIGGKEEFLSDLDKAVEEGTLQEQMGKCDYCPDYDLPIAYPQMQLVAGMINKDIQAMPRTNENPLNADGNPFFVTRLNKMYQDFPDHWDFNPAITFEEVEEKEEVACIPDGRIVREKENTDHVLNCRELVDHAATWDKLIETGELLFNREFESIPYTDVAFLYSGMSHAYMYPPLAVSRSEIATTVGLKQALHRVLTPIFAQSSSVAAYVSVDGDLSRLERKLSAHRHVKLSLFVTPKMYPSAKSIFRRYLYGKKGESPRVVLHKVYKDVTGRLVIPNPDKMYTTYDFYYSCYNQENSVALMKFLRSTGVTILNTAIVGFDGRHVEEGPWVMKHDGPVATLNVKAFSAGYKHLINKYGFFIVAGTDGTQTFLQHAVWFDKYCPMAGFSSYDVVEFLGIYHSKGLGYRKIGKAFRFYYEAGKVRPEETEEAMPYALDFPQYLVPYADLKEKVLVTESGIPIRVLASQEGVLFDHVLSKNDLTFRYLPYIQRLQRLSAYFPDLPRCPLIPYGKKPPRVFFYVSSSGLKGPCTAETIFIRPKTLPVHSKSVCARVDGNLVSVRHCSRAPIDPVSFFSILDGSIFPRVNVTQDDEAVFFNRLRISKCDCDSAVLHTFRLAS